MSSDFSSLPQNFFRLTSLVICLTICHLPSLAAVEQALQNLILKNVFLEERLRST